MEPQITRYANVAKMFADCAGDLAAFNSFHYGVFSALDPQDSALLPLLHLDAFINTSIDNGQIRYTLGFSTLDKGEDNGTLTYEGNDPAQHHICKALDRMELAGQQVVAWLAGKMEAEEYPYELQSNIQLTALPIIQEFSGVLTGWRWELVLEGVAINSYCDILDIVLELVLALVSSSPPTTSLSLDGSIVLAASGGVPPYDFTLNGVEASPTGTFAVGEGSFIPGVEDSGGRTAGLPAVTLTASSPCGSVLNFTVDSVALADGTYDVDIYTTGGTPALFRAGIGTAVLSGGLATADVTIPCDDGGARNYAVDAPSSGLFTDRSNAVGDTPTTFSECNTALNAFITLDMGTLLPAGTVVTFEVSIESATSGDAEFGLFYATSPTGGGLGLSSKSLPVDPGVKKLVTYTTSVNARYFGLSTQPNGEQEQIRVYRVFYGSAPTPITPGRYELRASSESLGELNITVP